MQTIPVVIRDDLMVAGDQSGWKLLTYAATPAAWGQAMEVPDMILYFTCLLSSNSEMEASGEYAARICTPGALISG